MSKESGVPDTMGNLTEHIVGHIGDALRKSYPRRTVLKAMGIGALAAALPACGPDNPPQSEKSPTPELPTSGIFAMNILLSDVNPIVRSEFMKNTGLEMTGVNGIQAVDPKDPKNMAGFFFVSTSDPKENYAMFDKPATEEKPASWVVSHITAAAMVNMETQQVSFAYLEDDGYPFLSFLLDKYIPRQSGETENQYRERA